MAFGDGVRRNIAHVHQNERDKLIEAIVQLDTYKKYADGVSHWDKQDQIHQVTHVHTQPTFLPWHRELCNRFEKSLREVNPELSLHYWDWTTDPRNSPDGSGGFVNLFSSSNFGSSSGRVGEPFETFDNNGNPDGAREPVNPDADFRMPPQQISRFTRSGEPPADSDDDIITSADDRPQEQQWKRFREVINGEPNHDAIHFYIGGPGGTISPGHSSFEDPFVFLLHSNVDRLWAMWQTVPGQEWRLDPNQVYGAETMHEEILEDLEPWSGTVHFGSPIPPWDSEDPDNQIDLKNSRHISVVTPPLYDTLPFLPQLITVGEKVTLAVVIDQLVLI